MEIEKELSTYIHLSKYSRWIESESRRETWDETVDRLGSFWTERFQGDIDNPDGPKRTEEIYETIESIRNLEVMPSMRSLMTAGPALQRDNVAGFNPVVGKTRVATKEFGMAAIESLGKGTATVLNKDGVWTEATFKCYGKQQISRVTLRKNSNTLMEVDCTSNHRWYLSNGIVIPTSGLRKGDNIPYVSSDRGSVSGVDYDLGLVHGLVFGDGTKQYTQERTKGYLIRVCGDYEDTLKVLMKVPEARVTYPASFNGDPLVQLYGTFSKTHRLKELPDIEETEEYMIGFFRGWLAADGSVSKNSTVQLCCSEEYANWVEKHSVKYGYIIQHRRYLPDKTNFGERSRRTVTLTIDRSSLTHDDFIIKRKRDRFKPLDSRFKVVSVEDLNIEDYVYCAEVPDTNTFVLDRGLLTGNCAAIAISHPRTFDEIFYLLMCGCGVGFSVERQYTNKLPEIAEEFHDTDTTIDVPDSKIGWAKGLKELIALLYNGDVPLWDLSSIRPAGARLKTFGGRACLTGDTLLYKDRKKSRSYNEITIRDLYNLKNSKGKWKGAPNHFDKVKIRSLKEKSGNLYRNNVVDVVSNGIAPVYQVTTSGGYKIKATMNHRFLADVGFYKHLEDFEVGDLIAVNGGKEKKTGTCMDCFAKISRRAVRCRDCANTKRQKKKCNGTTARQRKECVSYRKDYCEYCGNTESRTEVHHRDRNPRNNKEENLLNLCVSCHNRLHAMEDTYGSPYSHRYLSFDEIVGIEYVGEEEVFDIAMKGPDHNFVASGFISHNSGPEPLADLFRWTVRLFTRAAGRRLNSIECHDLVCKIADTVIVGSVRRSACISLSNLTDDRMRRAKMGEWYLSNPERALSNNSVAYTEKPDLVSFLKEFRSLYQSKAGERGIINKEALREKAEGCGREFEGDYLLNPCFHGDTLVETVEGPIPIKEITEPTYVYSMSNSERLVVRKCSASFVTKRSKVVKIVYNNNKSIRVTGDHKIYSLDNGWVEAGDLKVGERLQGLQRYRRGRCYAGVKLSSQDMSECKMEHRLVYEGVNGRLPAEFDVHHIDENTYNNSINNLEGLSHSSHATLTRLSSPNNHQVRCEDTGNFLPTGQAPRKIIPLPERMKPKHPTTGLRVKEVVYLDSETKVYDITVEGTHNLIADGIVAHNCGEAILRDSGGLCNLTEVVIRPDDTLDDLKRKVRYATILGTLQSTLCNFRYLRKVWKDNQEEERLLGVSFTGIMDHPIMSGRILEKIEASGLSMMLNRVTLKEWLTELKEVAVETNIEWAERLGINPSKQLTLVKPSGTVSVLCGTSSGIHPRYSPYYFRRVTQDIKDPLTEMMINEKIPYVIRGEKAIFSFPVKAPDGAIVARDMGAIQQLDLWKIYRNYWCEGNPSQTIYYTDDEFLEVQAWVWKNWTSIGGLSFFPLDDYVYDREAQPFLEVTEKEYEEAMEEFPNNILWSDLGEYESEDGTNSSQEFACSGGACEV